MKRGTYYAIAGVVVVGALALAGAGAAAPSATADPNWAPQIRRVVAQIETVTGPWPGLADYLIAVAYWESSHRDGTPPNPNACRAPCGPNSERGLFQIRPSTAGVESNPDILYDPTVAVAAATDLVYRLATKWDAPGQTVDWLAIRRGWRLPKLVKDTGEANTASAGVRERFIQALEGVGLSSGFMQRPALPAGMSWPGIDAIEQAVGIG